jgi:hypothetical protein
MIEDDPKISGVLFVGGLVGEGGGSYSHNCIFVGSVQINRVSERAGIGCLIGVTRRGQSELYYDVNKIGEGVLSGYYVPTKAIDKRYVGEDIIDVNVGGVSDWKEVDFSKWDSEIWDFDGDYPQLKMFKCLNNS